MTIKPVIAPTQNKRGGVGGGGGNGSGNSNSTTDTEKKETLGQVVGEQDAHGQSRSEAVYEELTRGHRRSPHKSPRIKRRDHHEQHSHGHGHSHSHSHGHHIHKRERSGVEKLTTNVNAVVNAAGNIIPKCQSPHSSHSSNVGGLGLASSSLGAGAVGGLNTVGSGGNNSPAHNNNLSSMSSLNAIGKASPEHLSAAARSVLGLGCSPLSSKNSNVLTPAGAAANLLKAIEDTYSGYNSGDEHLQPKEDAISVEEWQRRDEQFAKCMQERDYILKNVEEDGACLFRAISLQIYGDEEMHDVIRQHTMDYIYKNREYFSHFVTEDINSYIKRKRRKDSHGNHIEIQAMSEIYNRPVEVYCYKPKPINIFNSEQLKNGYAPLRLSYQRGSHYNAIIDPYNATVGVGLGLAGYKPDLQTKEAARLSEQLEIEQTMFEDKLKTTDWEATNEAIEEQIARESYLQWCRDNLQRSRNSTATSSTSATITSAEAMDAANAAPSHQQYAFMPRNGYTLSSGGGGPTSSTITSGAVLSMALSALPSATATSSSSESAGVSTLAATNQILGAALANVTAAVNGAGGGAGSLSPRQSQAQSELGYASDDTDMSSTSSVSYHSSGTGGDKSPGTVAAQKHRSKKSKSRSNATPVRTHKKRRCDQQQQQQQKSSAAAAKSTNAEAELGAEGGGSSSSLVTRKSPKPHAKSPIATRARSRSLTPEQQPCTSKQSNTPEKQQEQSASPAPPSSEQQQKPASVEREQPDSDKQQQESDKQQQKKSEQGGEEKSAAQQKTSSPSRNQSFTSFYQELLEASYATDGYGQLSESEMLQRAIQMSTQDYIQDQQRKYLYGP